MLCNTYSNVGSAWLKVSKNTKITTQKRIFAFKSIQKRKNLLIKVHNKVENNLKNKLTKHSTSWSL